MLAKHQEAAEAQAAEVAVVVLLIQVEAEG